MKVRTHTVRIVLLELLLVISSAGLTARVVQALSNDPPAEATSEAKPTTGLPQATQDMLDRLRAKVEQQAELAQMVNRADDIYRQGEALYKNGDQEEAQARFAEAQQVILSAEEEVFYEPAVRAYFQQLNRQIAALGGIDGLPSANGTPLSLDVNAQVRAYVRYFQGNGQNALRIAFNRLEQYEAMMRKIFQEEGVPEDLIYLGLVESAYNADAHSPAGAVGIWQFIADTGRRYGLRQSGGADDRHHPEKSTRAAAQYLRDLYRLIGDWPLALAAYNAGEYRVLKIMEKTGIRDFWQMSERGLLPQETRNYVPAVLAAITLGQQRTETPPALSASSTPSAQSMSSVKRVGKRY